MPCGEVRVESLGIDEESNVDPAAEPVGPALPDDPDVPAVPVPAAAAAVPRRNARAGGIRERTGQPWGLCLITPRKRDNVIIGYQMTCSRPCHNINGRCTKELHFDGERVTEEVVLRRLMAWVIVGAMSPDVRSHRFDSFKLIMQLDIEGGLPTTSELDDMKVLDWKVYEHANSGAEVAEGAAPAEAAEAAEGGPVDLGEAAPGCPPDVHAEMQALARRGALPRTTVEQRLRQRMVKGTDYGVPAMYRNALRHGYLNPNLPAPSCYMWRCWGTKWLLVTRGG